jgi:DNA helicase TIP49 (TBP-interacting protein)
MSKIKPRISGVTRDSIGVFFVDNNENVRVELLFDLICDPDECPLLDVELFVFLIRFIDHDFGFSK